MSLARCVAELLREHSGIVFDKYVGWTDCLPAEYQVVSSLPLLIRWIGRAQTINITPVPFENETEQESVDQENVKVVEQKLKEQLQRNYISARLVGGLGNQMFLIAVGYALAMKNGCAFTFEKVNHEPCAHRTVNDYWSTYLKPIVDNLGVEFAGTDIILRETREMAYTDMHKNANRVQISGYFQSAVYFDAYKPFLKLLFAGSREDNEYIREKYPFLSEDSHCKVAIHVRRGDYLKAAHYHHVLPAEYYQNAINDLVGKNKNSEKNVGIVWCVFSDDIEWCRGVFDRLLGANGGEVMYITGEKDYVELEMLKKFDDYILANSTFSWWGVYLNEKHEFPHAYMPHKWFEFGLYPHELVGAGWTKVQY